jgi:hypothetical protein
MCDHCVTKIPPRRRSQPRPCAGRTSAGASGHIPGAKRASGLAKRKSVKTLISINTMPFPERHFPKLMGK